MKTKTLIVGGVAVLSLAVGGAIVMRPIDRAASVDQAVESAVEPTETQNVVAVPQTSDTAPDVGEDAPVEASRIPFAADDDVDLTETQIAPQVSDRRFEPDGGFLVAGTAQPGKDVVVMVDGTEVERVTAQADGSFMALGFLGFSDTPRVMTLLSDPDGDAMVADQSYIFDANPAPVELASQQDAQTSQNSDLAANNTQADAQSDVVSDVEPTTPDVVAQIDEPSTPAILAISEDGVEVVQPAASADAAPEVMSSVALDTITYDPSGDVILGGRASGEGFVQVYVDNAPVGRLPVDALGRWRGDLPDVDTGVYTLRIDEIDALGEVVSRIETPFLREDPEDVIAAMAAEVDDPNFTIATRTVQSGMTLWAIAEERYGTGVMYVNVFEANKDRIRNPNLIYPGQVITLPDAVGAETSDNN